MKKLNIILFIVAFILTTNVLCAKEISLQQAEKVAKNFYYEVTASKGTSYDKIAINETFTIKKEGATTYYAFNFDQGGFVIVAADDVYTPIIGYNTEFRYETKNMPTSLQSFFDSYSEQIVYARENQIRSNYTEKWERLLSDNIFVLNTKNRDAVDPLGAPIWNQDYPYNYYCPTGTGGRTYAGCVATAMHMVMYYWQWPFVGEGDHGYNYGEYGYLYADFANSYYDWNGMVHSPSSFYPEISKMMYHIGISVDMMYGPDGSGAYSQDVPAALINHFKYKNTATHYSRFDYSGDWMQLIKNELNNKRIMYYSGCSNSGCHAFVCEGYNADDYFYFNLGWGGQSNGYYTLEHVGGYGQWQGVVVGIEPDTDKGYPAYCSGTKIITHLKGSVSDGSGPLANYQAGITCSWLIDPESGNTPIENITVKWRELNLAEGSVLNFYDGVSSSDPLIYSYTSSSDSPSGFTTTGKKLFVTFSSENDTEKGFHFEFFSNILRGCSNLLVINEPEGTLTDGSEENEFYAPDLACMFQINPGNGQPLTLKFKRIQLYEDDYDKIKIHKIITNSNYPMLTTLQGTYETDLPEIYIETGNALIVFETNNINNSKGWEVEWHPSPVTINKEIEPVSELSVFPNPASEKLNISFHLENSDNLFIRLYSMTGQLIYNETIKNFYGNYENTINVNDLQSGVYILNVQSSKGMTTQKVVIQ